MNVEWRCSMGSALSFPATRLLQLFRWLASPLFDLCLRSSQGGILNPNRRERSLEYSGRSATPDAPAASVFWEAGLFA